MITYVFDTLRSYPELAIFLTLGLGYALGKIRLGSFVLGSVTGGSKVSVTPQRRLYVWLQVAI